MGIKILGIAGSTRTGSFNKGALRAAVELAPDGVEIEEFDISGLPGFSQDEEQNPPGKVTEFKQKIREADAILFVSPEYNYSLPGTLKNLIDWVSRIRPVPLRGKHAVLLAASNGQFGGIRGLWQLRIPIEGLGMIVYPDMFALAWAAKAFTEEGELADPATAERLGKLAESQS